MSLSGLRGGIAFSLTKLVGPELLPHIHQMLTTCIAIILFTSFVQGKLCKALDVLWKWKSLVFCVWKIVGVFLDVNIAGTLIKYFNTLYNYFPRDMTN